MLKRVRLATKWYDEKQDKDEIARIKREKLKRRKNKYLLSALVKRLGETR